MNTSFLESFVNQEHVVLGKRLHAHCFYDVLLMDIDNNGLYTGEMSAPNWADLASAVLICSQPAVNFLKPKRYSLWREIKEYLWAFRIRQKYDLHREFAKFFEYKKDYDARPEFWKDSAKDSGGLKAPWVYAVACYIEAHSNMTEEQIMSAPIGKMMWKSAVIAECLGHSAAELMSDQDKEAMNALGLTQKEN